jgi:DNA-binding GntR family transcriptional regulator
MTLLPIETVSVVEAVAARLRDRILDGNLGPGSAVTENEVASQYSVSRPTAKGAITMLIGEELLRRQANKSASVPRLTSDDVRDLFMVRIPLELEAVRLTIASMRTPEGLAQAVQDVRAMKEAPPSRYVEADLRFHRLLVESVGSRRLTRVYRTIRGEIHMSMVQSQRVLGAERVSREHGAILDAIRARDATRATELMRRHLEDACRDVASDLDRAHRQTPQELAIY